VVAFDTGLLPNWWAALMCLVAVVLVIGPIGWAALIFGVPIWTLGTTFMLMRRSRDSAQIAPAAA
jgi:type IV secretory pathway TrbD component